MGFDYSHLRGIADRLIGQRGVAAVLHRPGGFDESTYPPVQLPGSTEACTVYRSNFSAEERAGTLIEEGDVNLLIAVTDEPPTTADKIEIGGIAYNLQSVEAVYPGPDVLMYRARGRI